MIFQGGGDLRRRASGRYQARVELVAATGGGAAHISKVEMARRMHTSPSHLDRLLDPDNERVQLDTLMEAAAVGKRVRIELENYPCWGGLFDVAGKSSFLADYPIICNIVRK